MRFLFALIFCGALSASPLLAQESSPTVPPAAAESGKDVVHALNNAFAKVFEIVAPSVVIIEVSKKNDGNEGFNFDDLKAPDSLCGLMDTSLQISTWSRGPTMWMLN